MSQKPQKIFWAVDAFSGDSLLNNKLVGLLKKFTHPTHDRVEPVYVLSPDQLNIPVEIFSSAQLENETAAKKNLEKLVKKAKLKNALPPKLLTSIDFSLKSAVRALVLAAKKSEAELIAVGTQSKKGVTRFLFGSFAETLVLYSDVPVLMVTPNTKPTKQLKNLFFATDLSEASKEAYARVLTLAQKHKLTVTLFNKVEYLSEYTVNMVTLTPSYEDYLERDVAKRKKTLAGLAEQAKRLGIKATVVIESKPSAYSTSECVLNAAKKAKADLIAVASQSGPVATNLLGSVVRQIIRHAKSPIWIIHPSHSAFPPGKVTGQGASKEKN